MRTEDINIIPSLKALEFRPDDPKIYFTRGNIYLEHIRDIKLAMTDYDKAILLDPLLNEAYCNRGICYSIRQNYSRALEDFNKSIDIKTEDAIAYYNRGLTYSKLSETDKAREDWRKAYSLSGKKEKLKIKALLNKNSITEDISFKIKR